MCDDVNVHPEQDPKIQTRAQEIEKQMRDFLKGQYEATGGGPSLAEHQILTLLAGTASPQEQRLAAFMTLQASPIIRMLPESLIEKCFVHACVRQAEYEQKLRKGAN